MADWFKVDPKGFGSLRDGSPKETAVAELIQNALDAGASNITVLLQKASPTQFRLSVEDDTADGFKNLADSYTLFSDTGKRSDPTKRGRFGMGMKLLLAVCDTAKVTSTKGTVIFETDGRRSTPDKRPAGTLFSATVRMTVAESKRVVDHLATILLPTGVTMKVNDTAIDGVEPLMTISAALESVQNDESGILRTVMVPDARIEIVELSDGEVAYLYEQGIPIMATGDKYHYNVLCRIPRTMDSEAVPARYLASIRVAVAEALTQQIVANPELASEGWVREAASSKTASPQLVDAVVRSRFGTAAVYADDEASADRAEAAGHTVVRDADLTPAERKNVAEKSTIQKASEVAPEVPTAPIAEEQWNAGMKKYAAFIKGLTARFYTEPLTTQYVDEPNNKNEAYVKDGVFVFNLSHVTESYFNTGTPGSVASLGVIITAIGGADKSVGKFAARVIALSVNEPEWLKKYMPEEAEKKIKGKVGATPEAPPKPPAKGKNAPAAAVEGATPPVRRKKADAPVAEQIEAAVAADTAPAITPESQTMEGFDAAEDEAVVVTDVAEDTEATDPTGDSTDDDEL